MTRSWLEHAAAFIVLWFALAIIIGVTLAAAFRHGAREMPPAPVDPAPPGQGPGAGLDPPEWEPDDREAQRIAEMFAEAAAEEDHRHD